MILFSFILSLILEREGFSFGAGCLYIYGYAIFEIRKGGVITASESDSFWTRRFSKPSQG